MFGDDLNAYAWDGYCWVHNCVTRGLDCDLCMDEARDRGLDLEEQQWWEDTTPPLHEEYPGE